MGYRGRLALYELMKMTDQIRDATVSNSPTNEIKRLALSDGMRTLRISGNRKILEGRTTLEEVMTNTVSDETDPELLTNLLRA